jgi:RHS repeat-associated protein
VTATITTMTSIPPFIQPLPGVPVSFQVTSGPNTGATSSGLTDANGQTSFAYMSNGQAGTDTIQTMSSAGPCPTVTVTWIAPDQDGDGAPDSMDNCPAVPNSDQADADGDGDGDVCDNCPTTPNANQADGDGDGDGDVCDNCPTTPNADQADNDGDGVGNACDVETCDGVDNDGDGKIDEGFPDFDGDTQADCVDADDDNDGDPDTADCAPLDPSIHHAAPEVCNGVDDNCNGQTDEGVTTAFYQDADGDGFGHPAVSQPACSPPPRFVMNNLDCDDTDANIHPAAAETCDGADNNCDGQVDEGFPDTNGDGTADCLQGGAAFNGPLAFNLQIDPHHNCGCPEGSPPSVTGSGMPDCGAASNPSIKQDAGRASVYLHNGEFFLREVDLEIPGRGFNWMFARSYRSGISFNGPHNWEFNYNRRLVAMTDQHILRMDGYARADAYTLNPDGSFTSPVGFYTRLVKNPDGTLTEREPNGTRIDYGQIDVNSIAMMSRIVDRNGNTMRFIYNGQNQLIQVVDTLGRPVHYRYNEQGRLIEVYDFIGRSILFEYDQNGDLVAVRSPVVTRTPTRNDFPQGKTVRYRYSSGLGDEMLNHNLLTVTAPNEVASGGAPRVRIDYETDPASSNFDRVLHQTNGGTNRPAEFSGGRIRFRPDVRVPAGGTISYEYRFLGQAAEDDFTSPVSQTTVMDRNGNRTEYQFNQLGNIVRIREFTNRDIRPADPEFYETRYEYTKDGELTRTIYPEGNSVEYMFDDRNPDRFQQGNLLAQIRRPDPERGGDQEAITTSFTYEPIYNRIRTVTEARGHDPGYSPPNGGPNSPGRYTTANIFDYQEGENFAALAARLGVSEAEIRERLRRANVPMGLGDVNGDGRTDQIAGNIVKVIRPTVHLLPDSIMARIERGTEQPIEETFSFNRVGQITRRRDAEGNVTIYTYYPENDPDGDGRDVTPGLSAEPLGYLRETIRDAERSPEKVSSADSTPAEIHHRTFYDRVGNIIKEVDGRGIATEYIVNQLNQVVQIIRAADVSDALRNPEEPSAEGCSDPGLVECQAGMVAFRYVTNLFYDFNNNIIRREVENRDSNNRSLAGGTIEFTLAYDILDHLIEQTQEVSETPREVLITRYRYDRNENLVLIISPAATAGEQPSNVRSYVFDERDLLFTATRGGVTAQFRRLGAHADIPERNQIPNSRDISTVSGAYDLNWNLKQFTDAADNNGDGQPEVTTYLYDGFDRRISTIDAAGNQSFVNYDPAGHVIRVSRFGAVGGPTPQTNRAAVFAQPLNLTSFRQPLLSRVEYKHDELGRIFERDRLLFDYQADGVQYGRAPRLSDGPLGASDDGIVVTRYEYDRNSRRTVLVEDDLSTFQWVYDGANRLIERIDPGMNRVQYTYDDNSNVVKIVEVEVTAPDDVRAGKAPDLCEVFTTINVYDSLNRLIRTTDNIGQTTRHHYDSRNNLIFTSDAQYSRDPADLISDPLALFPNPQSAIRNPQSVGPQSAINRPGNTVEFFYDGLNRKIAEVRHLRVGGQGKNPIDTSNPANPDGLIVMDYDYDANSRLVAMADDGSTAGDQNTTVGFIELTNPKGNITRYAYDDLNRRTQEIFDDGTVNTYSFDADDHLTRTIDQNGSIIGHTYDGIHRLVRRDITRAISETAHPAGGFKEPGLNWRIIGTTEQQFDYDGLSRMTRSFDNNDPDDPSDDATVTFAYDSLGRRLEEVQNGRAVSSRWAGDDNRTGLVYPNGREIELTFDKLDRIDRMMNNGQLTTDNGPIVDYDYLGPSRVLERTSANGVRLTYLDNTRQQDVGYDGLRRVVQHRQVREDNSLVAGFVYDYDRANNKVFEIKQHDRNLREDYTFDSRYRLARFARQEEPEDTWQLDGVGNWANRQGVMNQSNNLNEYTTFAGARQLHDDNGNLTEDGRLLYQYDAANRLRKVIRKADQALIAVYRYDAHGRRTERIVTNTTGLDDRVGYFYDGWREIEERRAGRTQQYVYGRWIDEPLVLDRDDNNDGVVDETFFYHQDAKTHVAALTDAAGRVVERVTYDAYGRPSVDRSAVGNPYFFSGRRYDPETGLYYYRARYYDPSRGRFIQRDPIGLWTDDFNLGNGYTYVGNDPINEQDPSGLFTLIELPVFVTSVTLVYGEGTIQPYDYHTEHLEGDEPYEWEDDPSASSEDTGQSSGWYTTGADQFSHVRPFDFHTGAAFEGVANEIRPSQQSPTCRGQQETVSTYGGLSYSSHGPQEAAASTYGSLGYAPMSNEPLCPLVSDASRLQPAPLPGIGPQVRVPEPGPQGQTFTVGGSSGRREGQVFTVAGPSRRREEQVFTVGPCSRTPGAVNVGEPSPQVFTVRP